MKVKMKAGKYMIPVELEKEKNRLVLRFGFNRSLLEEIKAMEGAKWHGYEEPPRKVWSIADSARNRFQLDYLMGNDPYGWFDRPLVDYTPTPRPCYRCKGKGCEKCNNGFVHHYQHQIEMVRHILTRRRCILAAEMGCLGPDTLIKCEKTWTVKPIKDWSIRPYLRSYNHEGEIVVTRARRIIKKTMKRIRINNNLVVGENHLFLTRGGQLQLAKDLILGDCLYTNTSRILRANDYYEVIDQIMDVAWASITDESSHIVPNSLHNLTLLPIYSIERLDDGDVYDLTIPIYGNYFDANGVSHQNTGKTLSAIEAIDHLNIKDVLWVGPRSALASVKLEFRKWQAKILPEFYTYEGLKKLIESWPPGKKSPHMVVFDESSRVKNHTAQRSQAAKILSEMIREDWGDDGYIVLMSGSPAPKSPVDWYWQTEIACPGYIREGTLEKFKQRLGLIVQKESVSGGSYPHLITWRDSEKKCNICGAYETDNVHDIFTGGNQYHAFEKSVNEVAFLYKRMQGLTLVKFKKDLMDLPDKVYEIIHVKPSRDILNAAKLIQAKSNRAITALTLMRQLSDGFNYIEEHIGTKTCTVCNGKGKVSSMMVQSRMMSECPYCDSSIDSTTQFCPTCGNFIDEQIANIEAQETDLSSEYVSCPQCGGSGEMAKYARQAIQVDCPKADRLKEIIEEHEDVGRIVTYAGFSGSVDRCCSIAESAGWEYLRVDGRGWKASFGEHYSDVQLLEMFQEDFNNHPKLVFVGQPTAAGMGLTLTASPTIVYYSNDFNAESRIQSEDRIHRPGMDLQRGARIIDLIHLPTDLFVRDNLMKKRRLQDMSMGQVIEFNQKFNGNEREF